VPDLARAGIVTVKEVTIQNDTGADPPPGLDDDEIAAVSRIAEGVFT